MDVLEAIEKRASIRKYKNTSIDVNMILQLIDSARLAPSAMNQQTWEFIWVTDPEIRKQVYDVCESQVRGKMPYIIESGGLIAGVCKPSDNPRFAKLNVAIALQNITIAAMQFGLGTCWVGAFDPKILGKVLQVPEDHEIVSMLVVGWPDENPPDKDRKELSDILYKDKYGQFMLK